MDRHINRESKMLLASQESLFVSVTTYQVLAPSFAYITIIPNNTVVDLCFIRKPVEPSIC